MKKIIFILCILPLYSFAQTSINKVWSVSTGNPVALEWSTSILNSSDEIISVGNTAIAGQGANILTTKYDEEGVIEWSVNYNTSGVNNDYGVTLQKIIVGIYMLWELPIIMVQQIMTLLF